MNPLLRKKTKYNSILFFIMSFSMLLIVILFICFDLISSNMTPSGYGNYPFKKEVRWVSTDPYFVLEYKYVDGELSEESAFLEINGKLQEGIVDYQRGTFTVTPPANEVTSHNDRLFEGTWGYQGDKLVFYIDDDSVFGGAYKEIVFEPEAIVDQDTQYEQFYETVRENKMTYDYNVYFRQNCVVPLFFASFSFIMLIGFFVSILKERGANSILKTFFKEREAPPLAKVISSIIFLLIPLFLIIANIFPLFRGGIYLLYEKETDQIQVSGKIEETMEIDSYTGAKYGTENNHGKGEVIVVNGEKYYLTTYGDFDVGDDVILNVLPRSGFVLEMERVNSESISETSDG